MQKMELHPGEVKQRLFEGYCPDFGMFLDEVNLVSGRFLLPNVGGLLSRHHRQFECQEADPRSLGAEKMPGWFSDSTSSPFSLARSVFRQKLVGSVKNGIDGHKKARVIEHKINVEGSSCDSSVTEHIVEVIRETTPDIIPSVYKEKGATITYPDSTSDTSSPTLTDSIFADSDFNSADEAEVFGDVVITELDSDDGPEAVSSDWMSSLSRSVEMKSEVSGPVSTEKFSTNSPNSSASRNCSLPDLDFLALQPLFALDHTPAKSKSSVARSGSHSGRKPPSKTALKPSGATGGNAPIHDDSDFFSKWASAGLEVARLVTSSEAKQSSVQQLRSSPLSAPVENSYHFQSFADFRQCVKEFQDETIELGRQRIDELHHSNTVQETVIKTTQHQQVTYATVNKSKNENKSDAASVTSLLSKSNTDIDDEPSWRRELKTRRSLRGSVSCNNSASGLDSRSASPAPSSASWLSEIWHRSTPLAERIKKNSAHDLTNVESTPVTSDARVSRRPSAFNARKTIERRQQIQQARSSSEPRPAEKVKLSIGGSLEKSKSLSSLEQESQKDETEMLTKSASSPTLEKERTNVHSYLFGTSIANQLDYHLEESVASSKNSLAASVGGETQKFNRNDDRRKTYAFEKTMDDHIKTSIDYLKNRDESPSTASNDGENDSFWTNQVKLRSTPNRERLLNGNVETKRTILSVGAPKGVMPSEISSNAQPVVIKIDRYENRHPPASTSSPLSGSTQELVRNTEERRSLRERGPFLSKVMLRRSSQSPERQLATKKLPDVEILSKEEANKNHHVKTKELMKLLESAPQLSGAKKEEKSSSKSEENMVSSANGPNVDLPRPGMPFNVKLRHVRTPGSKEEVGFPAYDFDKPNYLEMIPDLASPRDVTLVENDPTAIKPPPKSILKRRSVDNILDEKNPGVPTWLEAVQRRNASGVDWTNLESKKGDEPKRVSWLEGVVLRKTESSCSEDDREPPPKTYLFGETEETLSSSKLNPSSEPKEVTIVESTPVQVEEKPRESLVQKLRISFDQEGSKVKEAANDRDNNVVVKISPTSDGPPIVDINGSSDHVKPSSIKTATNRVEIIENSRSPSAVAMKGTDDQEPAPQVPSPILPAHQDSAKSSSGSHEMPDLSVMKHLTSIRLNSEAPATQISSPAFSPVKEFSKPSVVVENKPPEKKSPDLKSDAIPGRSSNLRAKLPASLMTPGAPLRLFDRREVDRLSLRETRPKKSDIDTSSTRSRLSADFEPEKSATRSASNLLHLLPQTASTKAKLLSELKLKPLTKDKKEVDQSTPSNNKAPETDSSKRRSSTGRNFTDHLRRKKSGDGEKLYDEPLPTKPKKPTTSEASTDRSTKKPSTPAVQRPSRAGRRSSNDSQNADATKNNNKVSDKPAVRKFEHPCADVRIPLASNNGTKGRYEKHSTRNTQARVPQQINRRPSFERPNKEKPTPSPRSKSAVTLRKSGVTRRSTDKLLALVKSAANNVSGSVSSDSSRRIKKRDSGKSTVSSKSSTSSLMSLESHRNQSRASRKDRLYPNGTEPDEDFTYIDLSKAKKYTSLEEVEELMKPPTPSTDEHLKQRLTDIISKEKSRLRSISASPSRESPETRKFLFGEKTIFEEEGTLKNSTTSTSPKRRARRKCSLDDILKSNAFQEPERSASRMSTASKSSAGHEFLVSTQSSALTSLGNKYKLSSTKSDAEDQERSPRSRLQSDASTIGEFPASDGVKFSLDSENNIVVEAFDKRTKEQPPVIIEELHEDAEQKRKLSRKSSGPLKFLDADLTPLQNGDYVNKRHLLMAIKGNEPKITEPDSDVSINGYDEPNMGQLVPSSVQRRTEASSGGTKYVTRTITTSPQGHTTVTTEGVKNRIMSAREILSDGPWSGVREVKGAQDQRLTVEECTKGGSKISRVVTQSHSSRSVLTITKLSRR